MTACDKVSDMLANPECWDDCIVYEAVTMADPITDTYLHYFPQFILKYNKNLGSKNSVSM